MGIDPKRTRAGHAWEGAPGYGAEDLAPLLEATSLRLDASSCSLAALDGLDLATRGERVILLGAPRVLFAAAAGLRAPTRGQLRTLGLSPLDAVRECRAAGAPAEERLPPSWTVAQYVAWSARLSGKAAPIAKELAAEAIEQMELGTLARSRLASLAPAARRATVLAAALATRAGALLVEEPVAGLPDDILPAFERVVAKALEGRTWVVFAARIRLESPLATLADEVILLQGTSVLAQGTPSELAAQRGTLALKMNGTADAITAFADAIRAEGGSATAGPETRGPFHLRIELGPLASGDVFRLALATQATVLEVRPLLLPLI
jgi:ABC-type multidrug transport system ATPase subunit